MNYWKPAVSSPKPLLLPWPDPCRHWLGSGCSQNCAPAADLKQHLFPVLAVGQSPFRVITSIQRFEELFFSFSLFLIKNWRLLPISKSVVFWAWAAHGPFQAATTFGCKHQWLSSIRKFFANFYISEVPRLIGWYQLCHLDPILGSVEYPVLKKVVVPFLKYIIHHIYACT